MATPDLSKLNFSDIKTSLTDYLQNQNIFSGYNFEGSALQTIIDLLAYNTYYYAFYSSMITNELFLDTAKRASSIISLTKPLGYTVPGLKSSIATVTATPTAANVIIPRYTQFNGVRSDGRYHTFYNTSEISVLEGVSSVFNITEAHSVVVEHDVTELFDLTTQTYVLDNSDVDISTIRVEIRDVSGAWSEWTSVNYFPNTDSNVFYIERENNDFLIQFGKENNLGKSLISTDSIRISYLRSGGSAANGINVFSTSAAITISSVDVSFGGLDGVDVELIKFAAPKFFSAQNRAITKNDYYGLLINHGYFSDLDSFKVFGGEEIFPPKYGRVFVTFKQQTTGSLSNVPLILDFLKEKCTLSMVPEYVTPKEITTKVYATFTLRSSLSTALLASLKNKINTLFNSQYAKTNKFNVEFDFIKFSTQALLELNKFGLLYVNLDKIRFRAVMQSASKAETYYTHFINFENSLTYDPTVSIIDSFVPSTIPNITGVPIQIFLPSTKEITGPQSLIVKNLNGDILDYDVGIVDIANGYFEIPSLNTNPMVMALAIDSTNPVISPIFNSLTTLSLTPDYIFA